MASCLRVTGGRGLALIVALLTFAGSPALAQQESVLEQEAYLKPPPEIARIVAAPRHENVSLTNLGPDGRTFLRSLSSGLPTVADYAKPHILLGGMFIDTRASRIRSLTVGTGIGFELIDIESGRTVNIAAPAGAKVSGARWSPDGKSIAFMAHFDDATYLYLADASNGKTKRITSTPLLATFVTSFYWTADSRSIVAVVFPEKRGPAPAKPASPEQPLVLLTSDGENKTRTYASLLETQYDQRLVEYFTTGQLAVIDVARGRVQRVGEPAMIRSIDPAPRGDYFRVTTMRKPFSYIVPISSFGTVEEVWDTNGNVLMEISSRPLNEGIRTPPRDTASADSTADEPRRSLAWRPDGNGFSFLQMEPAPARSDSARGGQGAAARAGQGASGSNARAQRKDRLMQWLPPFDSTSARVIYESDTRISNVQYSTNPKIIFVTAGSQTYAVNLDEPDKRYTITRGGGGGQGGPGMGGQGGVGGGGGGGSLMTTSGGGRAAGLMRSVVRLSSDDSAVYLSGTITPEDPLVEAPRPWVDRVEIQTGKRERIFESSPNAFERVSTVLDDDLQRFIITRESPTQIQNYFLVDRSTGNERQLTQNVDFAPEVTGAQRRIIQVTRGDGFKFRVRVTLPANHSPGNRLPAMFWFYPREYTDQASYDRTLRNYNKNLFPRVGTRSMEILTVLGYAVVEPDAPIVGPSGRMNDFYIHDLRNNLAAVIDELDRQGIIDRNRLGLGGHSYGAFSTANAMVHTPFFKAGIAGDGNSNRMLTPAGFQTERRELWQARDLYLEMSPLLYADRLNGALLMYHGMDDQNVGTHLIHSERLFHALNALGKTAALYKYPYEDHGPATVETQLDLWARWIAWLDKYVKNADRPKAEVAAVGASN